MDLLPGYPSEAFTCVTLRTLTALSARTLVGVPQQVELLVKALVDDHRAAVKTKVVEDLRYLANAERAHLWTPANVASVILFAQDCQVRNKLGQSNALKWLNVQ